MASECEKKIMWILAKVDEDHSYVIKDLAEIRCDPESVAVGDTVVIKDRCRSSGKLKNYDGVLIMISEDYDALLSKCNQLRKSDELKKKDEVKAGSSTEDSAGRGKRPRKGLTTKELLNPLKGDALANKKTDNKLKKQKPPNKHQNKDVDKRKQEIQTAMDLAALENKQAKKPRIDESLSSPSPTKEELKAMLAHFLRKQSPETQMDTSERSVSRRLVDSEAETAKKDDNIQPPSPQGSIQQDPDIRDDDRQAGDDDRNDGKDEDSVEPGSEGGEDDSETGDDEKIINKNRKKNSIIESGSEEEEEVEEEDIQKYLRFTATSSNVVDIRSGVYCSKKVVKNAKQSPSESALARLLLVSVFSDYALKTCSLEGNPIKGPMGKYEMDGDEETLTPSRPALPEKARDAVLAFASKIAREKDSTMKKMSQPEVKKSLGSKLSEIRRKRENQKKRQEEKKKD